MVKNTRQSDSEQCVVAVTLITLALFLERKQKRRCGTSQSHIEGVVGGQDRW